MPGLVIRNEVRASKSNGDHAYVFGSPWGGDRKVRGTIPQNRDEFKIKATLPNPAKFLGEKLKGKLHEKGIIINGEVIVQKADSTSTITCLFVSESPRLAEIAKVLNHESVNLFAEQFLKHIGFTGKGTGSTEAGTGFIMEFWKGKGLNTTGMFIEDGSGLSHFNAVSAAQLTWILNYMRNSSRVSAAFFESLPVAGKGTLTVFSPDDFPDDCLHAKSGSITRVKNYCGYLKTATGRELVFAFLFNNFSLSQTEMTREIGKLLLALRKQY